MHIAADDRIGRVQDVLGGAVVLLQQDDRGVGEVLAEAFHIAEVRAPKRIDGLVFIPYHEEVAMPARQQFDQLILGGVRVLKLIHQDEVITMLVIVEDVGVLAQHEHRPHQQIVEIQGAGQVQKLLITLIDAGDHLIPIGLDGELGRAQELVFGPGDGAEDGAGLVAFVIQVQVSKRLFDDLELIVGVEDDVAGIEANLLGLHPQEPGANAVEGADAESMQTCICAQQLAGTLLHHVRGFVGEGDCEDAVRGDAHGVYEVGDAVSQDSGLARAGPGQHEHGAVHRGHGLALRRIEVVESHGGAVPEIRFGGRR